MDINSITLPYFIDDIFQSPISDSPEYHANFIGTIVTHTLRAYMLIPFLGKTNLPHYNLLLEKLDNLLANRKNRETYKAVMDDAMSLVQHLFPLILSLQEVNYFIDISVEQFPRLPKDVQAIKKAQLVELMAQSVATLCPRGFGVQSIRFFETLSAGRIPILISDYYCLPLENRIDYSSILFKIDESEVLKLRDRVAEFFKLNTMEDLRQKANAARDIWVKNFSPQKVSHYVHLTLADVLKEDYRLNKI